MSQVSLIKADSYELDTLYNSIQELLEPLGGISAFVKKDDRVLLKPKVS